MEWHDELGYRLEFDEPPERIVSLVPSLTETLFALGLKSQVVGVTKFCVEPAGEVESIEKVGGTKNPDLRAIAALDPDLVIANAEENRQQDVERMRAGGLKVFVTYPRNVSGALESILGLGRVTRRESEAAVMAREVVRVVSVIETSLGIWNKLRLRVFCPIWKKPWMTFNEDTYAHDVLRLLGFLNVYGDSAIRYPRTTLEEALDRQPQVVVLPDEPYEFGEADVAELKAELPSGLSRRIMLIGGRDLHWYGVHMIKGLAALAERLGRLRASITPAG
ncbi:MAG TPA: helical backbone metal receptor [Candidatus Binataceae bacterium]|nr:helical backbone metal receptor [Candidatus Binataceae bacterium]